MVHDGVMRDRRVGDGWWWLADKERGDMAVTVTLSWDDRDFVTDQILSVGTSHKRLLM
jgi:hypothetical protein